MPAPDWSGLAATSLAPDRVRPLLAEWAGLPSVAAWLGTVPPAAAKSLVTVLGASASFAGMLHRNPAWLAACFSRETLAAPRPREILRREIGRLLDLALAKADHAGALRELRSFRQREHIRIAARDLSRAAAPGETHRQLSDVADLCLAGALRVVRARVASTLGEPWEETGDGGWRPTPFCILGLGKLGGQEPGYGPDLEVMLVYGEEGCVFRRPPIAGRTPPSGGLQNNEFFRRLAEEFVAEVSEPAPEGSLYHIDIGRRAEGSAGPLARSANSLAAHYTQRGQAWERLMLVKTRHVAGDRQLAADFLEMIQPFRYTRTPDPRLVEDLGAARRRLEIEPSGNDAGRDVEFGPGGIREIEFTVQSLQVLHGGRQPFVQNTATLAAIDKLAEYGVLSRDESQVLGSAHRFWREVGHRLEIENPLGLRAMPDAESGRQRLARLMGFRKAAEFISRCGEHRDAVLGLRVRLSARQVQSA